MKYILILSIAALALTSCEKEGQKMLGGTWEATSLLIDSYEQVPDTSTYTFIFTENHPDGMEGDLRIERTFLGANATPEDYTYNLNNDTLIYNHPTLSTKKWLFTKNRNKLTLVLLTSNSDVTMKLKRS